MNCETISPSDSGHATTDLHSSKLLGLLLVGFTRLLLLLLVAIGLGLGLFHGLLVLHDGDNEIWRCQPGQRDAFSGPRSQARAAARRNLAAHTEQSSFALRTPCASNGCNSTANKYMTAQNLLAFSSMKVIFISCRLKHHLVSLRKVSGQKH